MSEGILQSPRQRAGTFCFILSPNCFILSPDESVNLPVSFPSLATREYCPKHVEEISLISDQ